MRDAPLASLAADLRRAGHSGRPRGRPGAQGVHG